MKQIEHKLKKDFSFLQIQTAKTLLEETKYEEEPEVSEGINKELCLSWVDGDLKVLHEIHSSGFVASWVVNTANQKFEGEI